MKNNKFLLIAIICLIVLSLTGCSSSKDQTSYKTPLGEVAYLADVDYKLNDNIKSVSLNLASDKENKKAVVSVGYYDDEYAKKNFTALKSSEKINLTEQAQDVTFDFNDVESDKTLYLLVCVGTSLDDDAKTYRETTVTIKVSDAYFKDLNEAEDKTLYAQSRYANTMSIDEKTESNLTTDVVKLNQLSGVSQFFANIFGTVLYFIVHNICGDIYWLGLLIFTILLRTLGWPIYAKSNSTSQGMSKIQPEIDRLNKKYEGKTDQNSKMKQQMEMREIMKKNKVSMWGCLLPFVQMPIFIVVYQMVRKFACTPLYDGLDYKFLWADLGAYQGNPEGDIALAILVGVTMVATQLLSTFFQKRQQKKKENFYTKQNAASQKQANMTLIIMTVVMTGMMVAFAWDSAGMAFYWIIGNVYQLGQTLISKIIQEKKADKEDLKNGTVRGRN